LNEASTAPIRNQVVQNGAAAALTAGPNSSAELPATVLGVSKSSWLDVATPTTETTRASGFARTKKG
jgi:hypothetical protein